MAKRTVRTPSPIHKRRLSQLRRLMSAKRIKALLVSSRTDGFYLTGFTGEDSALLIVSRAVHVITDGRFEVSIGQECPWATCWLRKGNLNEEIARVCESLKIKTLSFLPEQLTVADHRGLSQCCKAIKLSPAPAMIESMRCVKDDAELKQMKTAIKIAEDAFLAMRATIRVGQTELELAARLEFEMKVRGASGPSFATICAEGSNAALPHAQPGRRKAKRGSAILFDWGARAGMYCSDLTRLVFVGSIPPKIAKIYDVVLTAQQLAIDAIRPGQRMCDIDAVARDCITSAGFGKQFNHGLGHGLGLNVHEAPSLSWRSKQKLEAGMVVTVEPGIYLPKVGGVRIEDDVYVTASGRRVLSRLSKDIESAVV